jgi:hypothetical protein
MAEIFHMDLELEANENENSNHAYDSENEQISDTEDDIYTLVSCFQSLFL